MSTIFMNALPYIIEIVLFIVAVLACFYLPGRYILRVCKIEYSSLEAVWFPIVFGIAIFTTIAYFFSLVNLWVVIIPIILLIDYSCLRKGNVFPKKIRGSTLPVDSRIADLEMLLIFDKEPKTSNLYNYHKKEVENFLRQNNITYIYSPDDLETLKTISGIKKIYGKDTVYIYKIE